MGLRTHDLLLPSDCERIAALGPVLGAAYEIFLLRVRRWEIKTIIQQQLSTA